MKKLTKKQRHKENFLKTRKIEMVQVREPVLIVCEDSKSSVYYLREKVAALRLEASSVKVTGESGSHPSNVVEFARLERERNKKECKLNGRVPYKHIYCVMDVDDHTGLSDSIQRARDLGFIPIVSNQSFELWYLLHFIDFVPGYLHRDKITKMLSEKLGKEYDKGERGIYALLKEREGKAIELAEKMFNDAETLSDERNPHRNPCTEVYKLIQKLNELAGKQLVKSKK